MAYQTDIFSISIVLFITFIVSFFSVSTGGTSLITVPILISLGMPPQNAVATNMFGLIFLSLGGVFGFRSQAINKAKLIPLSLLTIAGSAIGAYIVAIIDQYILKKAIGIAICLLAIFVISNSKLGFKSRKNQTSKNNIAIGTIAIFALGVYGGFFSGGYVTILSYILILLFGISFLEAAFTSKVLNVCSSISACAIFFHRGLIDVNVGVVLAIAMTIGAFFGAKTAIFKGNLWVRNAMIIATIALAVKLLMF